MSMEKQMSERTTEETVPAVPMKADQPAPTPSQEDDGLDIPAFLRRI